MRRLLVALTVVAVPLAALLALLEPFSARISAQAKAGSGVEVDALDRKTDPCTDFYQFACGGWIAKNPVPADRRSWGRFQEVQDRNLAILRRILESPAAGAAAGAASPAAAPEGDPSTVREATSSGAARASSTDDRRKAADYYAACMDESKIEANGMAPIGPDLATIEEWLNPDDLPVLVAHLHEYGVPALFRFGSDTDLDDATQEIADVDQVRFGLPDRDYYVKTDEASAELRRKYVATITHIFALAGATPDKAASDATAVMNVETALATAALDRVTRRDPAAIHHKMGLNELQRMTPNFQWRKYASAAGAPPVLAINVSVPDYLKAMDALIASTPLADLKAYLRWQLLRESADLLPKAFADAHFDFFSRTLAGQQEQQPRWRRCVAETDDRLGEALGQAFVAEAFGPQAKADMLQMVQDIKAAMRQDIDAAPWMSGETKKAAMVKLEAVVDRIGYPETWRQYATLRVTRDEALGNRQRADTFERARTLQKIGKPVDRSEWSMTPPTVNPYYSPDRNNINSPAGILQPPFYKPGRDAAVNYGGAGGVIGHELTHGFDDQGRKFDAQGNLRDWWTPADGANYEQRATCVADQYSGYTVTGDTKINGRLTLGENTADNGGLRLALMAYLA